MEDTAYYSYKIRLVGTSHSDSFDAAGRPHMESCVVQNWEADRMVVHERVGTPLCVVEMLDTNTQRLQALAVLGRYVGLRAADVRLHAGEGVKQDLGEIRALVVVVGCGDHYVEFELKDLENTPSESRKNVVPEEFQLRLQLRAHHLCFC